MNKSENPCKDRGCKRCCVSPFFGMGDDNFRMFLDYCREAGVKIFENSPDGFQMVQGLVTDHPDSVVLSYCTESDSRADVLVQLVGPCPALNNGECDLKGRLARPTACEWITVDGSLCDLISQGKHTFIPPNEIVFISLSE